MGLQMSLGMKLRRWLGVCLLVVAALLPGEFLSSQTMWNEVEYISPPPGSKLVSQESNIIIRSQSTIDPNSVTGSDVFTIAGSKSGDHAGTLALSDDETSIMFEPFRPFASDEIVTVVLHPGFRTRSGDVIGPLRFSFRTSPLSRFDQEVLLGRLTGAYRATSGRTSPGNNADAHLSKVSTDSLPPGFPKRSVIFSGSTAPGVLFLGSFKIAEASDHLNFISLVPSEQQYLMILDNTGTPMFYRKMPSMSTDFKVQMNGYLTYYDNNAAAYYELDSSYAVIDSFRCGNGYKTDLHELRVLPDGHQLMLGYDPQVVDMSSIVPGGDRTATVIGAVIQELDRNKHVIFQWRTFDHFKVTDATEEDLTAATIDYVHPNTIEIDTDGNLLLSSRHMDEITKINRNTGDIIWRWGGKNNQFRYLGDSVGFSHQHTIRRTQSGSLLMLDNGNYRPTPYSSVVEYQLDDIAKTVRLIWQYRHTPDVFAIAMGSVDRFSNGNTLIGWGTTKPAITEVRPDGSVAFELQLPDSIVSYRVFRVPWHASSRVTAVKQETSAPQTFSLAQNYPNPFNPSTRIEFSIQKRASVRLSILDLLGRTVATLVEGVKDPGVYSVTFDGSHFASGVYFYRLATSGGELTRTMSLLK